MLRRSSAVAVLAFALLAPAPAQEAMRLSLGLYSFKKPTEVYKQFQPVAEALGQAVARQLQRPVTIDLLVEKTYEESLANFIAGKVDIVRFGPASYVLSKRANQAIELLAAEREDSRGVGLIVVRADSPVQSLADLAGRRFAFGDQQSTIGRYLSQAELVGAGVTGSSLAAFKYLDRHDIVFKAVEIGDYDAGALHAETFGELNAKVTGAKLRVVHRFDNVAKPWIARAGMDAAVVAALRQGLQKLDDQAALKALKVPGFAPTADADYDSVRKAMELAERFAPAVAAPPAVPPAAPKGS